jgi:hypothetical protein
MNLIRSGLVAAALLSLGGAALAQESGGPDAKGNAPLKASHTVNDGAPKAGANSFTQGQARKHILNAGYESVSGLTKGSDGVWRGVATKNGAQVPVALDFKGNVTEAAAH